LVLFLPLPLPALGVPVVGTVVAVLVGVIVANAQKRL
jgi:tetrahydromethanopterin S-methyltransferase subunit C